MPRLDLHKSYTSRLAGELLIWSLLYDLVRSLSTPHPFVFSVLMKNIAVTVTGRKILEGHSSN